MVCCPMCKHPLRQVSMHPQVAVFTMRASATLHYAAPIPFAVHAECAAAFKAVLALSGRAYDVREGRGGV